MKALRSLDIWNVVELQLDRNRQPHQASKTFNKKVTSLGEVARQVVNNQIWSRCWRSGQTGDGRRCCGIV